MKIRKAILLKKDFLSWPQAVELLYILTGSKADEFEFVDLATMYNITPYILRDGDLHKRESASLVAYPTGSNRSWCVFYVTEKEFLDGEDLDWPKYIALFKPHDIQALADQINGEAKASISSEPVKPEAEQSALEWDWIEPNRPNQVSGDALERDLVKTLVDMIKERHAKKPTASVVAPRLKYFKDKGKGSFSYGAGTQEEVTFNALNKRIGKLIKRI